MEYIQTQQKAVTQLQLFSYITLDMKQSKHSLDGINCYLVNIDTADYYKGELKGVYHHNGNLQPHLDFVIKENCPNDDIQFIRLKIYKALRKLEIITKDNFENFKSNGEIIDVDGYQSGKGYFVIILEKADVKSFISEMIPRLIEIKQEIAMDHQRSFLITVNEIGKLENKLRENPE